MATALPVVATRVGGNPELVPPDCGLLVPPGDANAVAAALGSLLASPALRRELGTRARLHVERHCHLEGMVEAYMDAFERVMVGRFPGAPAGCFPEMGGPR